MASSSALHSNQGQTFSLLYNPYQQAFLEARRKRLDDGTRAFNRFALIAGRRGGKTLIGALAAVEEASAWRRPTATCTTT